MATMTTTIYPEHVTVANSTHHALLAGASGSGKSTFLEGVINVILTKHPNDYQMVLIDPKRVELSRFKDTQNCIAYASEITDIEYLLDKCLEMVERRYKAMEQRGEQKYTGTKVYIIIDELADIVYMSKTAFNQIERLARIARAANVQLICATQCILSEVIPTRLKCNLDLRVALPTASANESRVILGMNGAETLNIGEAIIKIGCSTDKVKAHKVDNEALMQLITFRNKR